MGTVSQYSRQKDLLTFVNYDSLEGRDNLNKVNFKAFRKTITSSINL